MKIFMTGASGFVGGEVAASLVQKGHRLTALIRRSPLIHANDGTLVEGVNLVRGDISEANFGIEPDVYAAISREHDLILHCAASTRFDLDDDQYTAINVGGAEQAVALAKAGSLPLLHVSTAYVCGNRNGPIAEDDPLPISGWVNGYERSKAAAEQVVMNSGLHYAIARPSIVVGDSVTGDIREFGAVYGLFKLIAEGRFNRIPAKVGASLDFVPIDYVAAGIVELATRIAEASGPYHLVSGSAIPLQAAVGVVADFNNLHAPRLVDPETFDVARLSSRERWIFDNAFGHYSSYVSRNPLFGDARYRAFSGRQCPPTNAEYIRKLIQRAIDAGFVRAAANVSCNLGS